MADNQPCVLIVGGLGSLGDALIPKLITEGFHVIVGDIGVTKDGAITNPFSPRFSSVGYYHLNAIKPASIKDFRKKIESEGIRLSHIIDVVGALKENGLTDIFKTTARQINDTIAINLKAQLFIVRFLGNHLIETPAHDKSITLISSINALTGYSIPFYSAAKAGLHGFVRPAAIDLGQYGIRLNIITPGSVVTPVTAQQPKNFAARAAAAALGRLCNTQEVADAIMASVKLTGMTGQEIVVDAGQSINPAESLYNQTRQTEKPLEPLPRRRGTPAPIQLIVPAAGTGS